MDPLTLLREYVSNNKEIGEDSSHYIFGNYKVLKDEPTAYKARGGKGESYYTVKELMMLLKYQDLQYVLYMKKMGDLKMSNFVSKLDREDVLSYLKGHKTTSDQIDRSQMRKTIGVVSTVSPARGDNKRSASTMSSLPAEKLQRTDAATMLLSADRRAGDLDVAALQDVLRRKQKRRQELAESGEEDAAFMKDKQLTELDKEMKRMLTLALGGTETLVHDRNTTLLTPDSDYKFVLDVYAGTQKKTKDKEGGSKAAASATDSKRRSDGRSSHSRATPHHGPTPGRSRGEPIIIVPSGPSSLISLTNVAEFLEKAHFVDPKNARSGERVKSLTLTKTFGDGQKAIRFKVIDNPPLLLDERDWESVVAVVTSGKSWQFSDWKYSRPVDLFHRCMGAMIHYDDEPVSGEVRGWNVKFYKVNRTKRHLDGTAVSSFWNNLEDWMRINKPWILNG